MKAYRFKGSMMVGKKLVSKQVFTWEVAANDVEEAQDKLYAEIGSKHGVSRKKITIEAVDVISAKDVSKPRVLYALQRGK